MIAIKFSTKFRSIQDFNPIELEDFSIIVGKNGAGKTHLLKAIKEGKINIEGISINDISYFNFENFLIKNQRKITPRAIDDEKINAFNVMN